MRTYSTCSEYPVVCNITSPLPLNRDTRFTSLDFDVGETGSVFVNTSGLSVVFYSSIIIYESAIFGSNLRGYLFLFHYTLVNGPELISYQPVSRSLFYDYTRTHLVN